MSQEERKLSILLMLDNEYQQLLQECKVLENEYIRIVGCLTEQDRDVLDRYIAVCEELEFRRCTLAAQIKSDSLE